MPINETKRSLNPSLPTIDEDEDEDGDEDAIATDDDDGDEE
jgi:hypothetical protein